MPLFGSKKKNEFSGRPEPAVDDPAYSNRSSTLHKRNAGTEPIDARTNQPGYGQSGYGQSGYRDNTAGPTSATAGNEIDARKINDTPSTMGRKKTRGGLFGRGRRSSSRSSSSDEGRYVSPQTTGAGAFGTTGNSMHGTHRDGGINGSNNNTMNNGLQPYTGDDMGMAREKVHAAEEAEREALRMLGAARSAVKEAKDHIERLATQADEEARRAGMKQKEAQALRNDTRHLGRHI
ncbi:hypothetical protein FRC04_009716 [Tulasnella sp. 424]|nr:hypothetical protein FRC04_009716 [Tulasnella sp. 424]KAG8973173.1 hypothetical protein FRC05_009034 [Tulasnella sp. 425]